MVADYLIHFEPTKNDTVLPTARRILTEGVNDTRNTSNFRAFRVDIETFFVEDYNECLDEKTNDCDQNAICKNTVGSFECFCKVGYAGNGKTCQDIDECTNTSLHNCSFNSPGVTCLNTFGSYQCTCKEGYSGDGVTCNVINPCTSGTHNCHPNATCYTLTGSAFRCICNEEMNYFGNGTYCFAGCPTNHCENGGTCIISTVGNICRCPRGFYGDRCELGAELTSSPPIDSVNMWLLVIVLASVCGILLFVLLIVMICCCRRRRRDDDLPGGTPVRAKKYRPTRKSGAEFFETIDEDFTIPGRRLRATPPSASFREVANGLGAANRAMEQLSRVGQQHSQAVQARGSIQNLEPSYDDLVFDEFLENVGPWNDLSSGSEGAANNNIYVRDWAL